MELTQVQKAIETTPAGSQIIVEWTRPLKLRKKFEDVPLVKDVRMGVRIGVQYDHMGSVQEKRTNGELPPENAGLQPWQEWFQYPYLLRHKTAGTLYLRLSKGISEQTRPVTQFRINQHVVSFDDIQHMVLASELPDDPDDPKKKKSDCFQVQIDYLRRINTEQANQANQANQAEQAEQDMVTQDEVQQETQQPQSNQQHMVNNV